MGKRREMRYFGENKEGDDAETVCFFSGSERTGGINRRFVNEGSLRLNRPFYRVGLGGKTGASLAHTGLVSGT